MAITVLNLLLAVVIFGLGLLGYTRKRSQTALLVGFGFGLFAVSHLLTLFGLAATAAALIIVLRTFGYLMTIAALLGIVRARVRTTHTIGKTST